MSANAGWGFGPAQGAAGGGGGGATTSNLAVVMANAPNPGETGGTDLLVSIGDEISSPSSGTASEAYGAGASAGGDNSLSAGNAAAEYGGNNVVLGKSAAALQISGMRITNEALTAGQILTFTSVAGGPGSVTEGVDWNRVGGDNAATAAALRAALTTAGIANSVHPFGTTAIAITEQLTALGALAGASSHLGDPSGQTVIGQNATSDGKDTVVIGDGATYRNGNPDQQYDDNVIIGAGAQGAGDSQVVIGAGAGSASIINSTVMIGHQAQSQSVGVAIGAQALVTSRGAAIGQQATAAEGIAAGWQAVAQQGVALCRHADELEAGVGNLPAVVIGSSVGDIPNFHIRTVLIGGGHQRLTPPADLLWRMTNATAGGGNNDIPGTDVVWETGAGTGTGTPSSFIIKTPTIAGAGDSAQAMAARLTVDSSAATLTVPVAAPSISKISNGSAITAADTADAGERMVYDPTGGTFQIDAPASPVMGTRWAVKNRSASATAVTISGNGSNIEDPTASFALAASFSLSGDGIAAEWEYDGTQWLVI